MNKFLETKLGQLLKGAVFAGGSAAGAYLVTNGHDVPHMAAYITLFGAIFELVHDLLTKKE